MAGKIGDYMEEHGVNFIKECIPTSLEELEPAKEGKPGKIKVKYRYRLCWETVPVYGSYRPTEKF
jgi:hypothetical protein